MHADCSVRVGTNAYSVPWRLIGERVRVVVSGGRVRVYHDRDVVAEYDEHHGRITDRAHLQGINTGPLQVDAEDEGGDEPPLRGRTGLPAFERMCCIPRNFVAGFSE